MAKLENYKSSMPKWSSIWQPPTMYKSEGFNLDTKLGRYLIVCDDHNTYIQGTKKYLDDYRYTFLFCDECDKPVNYSRIKDLFGIDKEVSNA